MSVLNVNGKLTRIDAVAYGPTGDPTYTPGDALDVDVTIDEPTGQQRYVLGAAISEASVVIYVLVDDLPAGQLIPEGYQVVANQDGRGSVTYRVIKSQDREFEDLSHFVLFCKVA